jgi:hypothetical protein
MEIEVGCRRIAAVPERLLSCRGQRIAPGGTGQGLMLRRSPLRDDCTAVRAPGSCRTTRYAPSPAGPALRSNSCGKSVHEARWRAPTLGLCSSSPHKSPLAGAARREGGAGVACSEPSERCREDGAGQAAMRL